mmetsp:Transcript_17348/g.24269  ORF Transcript_17348/g.24269 Transcript_17348/m.24269 type:complete len:87 (+) Transcript_17348:1291-1551(+)
MPLSTGGSLFCDIILASDVQNKTVCVGLGKLDKRVLEGRREFQCFRFSRRRKRWKVKVKRMSRDTRIAVGWGGKTRSAERGGSKAG